MSRLPPLAALQAFESAARHQNFSRAAEELHLTHSAVSRQIKQLESRFGQPLFERNGPQVRLTATGAWLRQRIAWPLTALHDAMQGEQPATQALTVHCLASFASAWLVPRLPAFAAAHPGVALTIHTQYKPASLPLQDAEIGIRYGAAASPGLCCEWLADEAALPVASAEWLSRWGDAPSNWPSAQRLQGTTLHWPTQLVDALGNKLPLPRAAGMVFNDADVLLDAAEQGLGIAWARASLAQPRLARASLVGLEQYRQPAGNAYWLVYRDEQAGNPAVAAFREWIFAQTAADREPAGA
jgi:LysR family glycine cleavage system transcriptional activator